MGVRARLITLIMPSGGAGMYILQNIIARPKIGGKNAKLGVFRAILGINLWFLGIVRDLYAC